MKVGDKLKCLVDVDNVFGEKLFIKDKIYEIVEYDHYSGQPQLSSEFGYISADLIDADGKLYFSMRDFTNKCFTKIE